MDELAREYYDTHDPEIFELAKLRGEMSIEGTGLTLRRLLPSVYTSRISVAAMSGLTGIFAHHYNAG